MGTGQLDDNRLDTKKTNFGSGTRLVAQAPKKRKKSIIALSGVQNISTFEILKTWPRRFRRSPRH